MAKTPLNGNLKRIIGIVGLLITAGSIVFAAGGLRRDISQNADNIDTHYEQGCKPSGQVRRDLVGFDKDIKENIKDIAKIDEKLDQILAILMKP